MITRIVKLHFRPGEATAFRAVFNASKERIRQFDGCRYLALYTEAGNPEVYFTYSLWDSLEHLDAYRNSAFFKETWSKTTALFAGPPQAWSMQETEVVDG